VYLYGSGGFPTGSWSATNYWVDVVFSTSATGSISGGASGAVVGAGADGSSAANSISMGTVDLGGGDGVLGGTAQSKTK
jgi:hypothetical protein